MKKTFKFLIVALFSILLFACGTGADNTEAKKEITVSAAASLTEIMDELVKASVSMASKRIGALIVIERETGLKDFLEVGVDIDAKVSSDLLSSIFLPYSPIHDGAVVLQQGRLKRAGCFLPLSQNPDISKTLGTRHRAAIGLTELVDAVAIVVSEETGKVSVVVGGRITRDLDSTSLKRVLTRLFEPRTGKAKKKR